MRMYLLVSPNVLPNIQVAYQLMNSGQAWLTVCHLTRHPALNAPPYHPVHIVTYDADWRVRGHTTMPAQSTRADKRLIITSDPLGSFSLCGNKVFVHRAIRPETSHNSVHIRSAKLKRVQADPVHAMKWSQRHS
jgi:hypothetical protein